MRPITVLLLLVSVGLSLAANPGVKVRVTRRGLDYGKRVANEEISKQLKGMSVNYMSGGFRRGSWMVSGLKINTVSAPSTSYTLEPSKRGMTLSLRNLAIQGRAGHWRVKYKWWWIRIAFSGSMDFSISGVRVTQSVSFGTDRSGRPTVTPGSCSASIGHLSIRFSGKAYSWILNLFRGRVASMLKGKLQPKICEVIKAYIRDAGRRNLGNIEITSDISDKFILDYKLVAQPVVSSRYLEMHNKGEISWKTTREVTPFDADPIPSWSSSSRMVYIWVTDYTPNSYLYQAHAHGHLDSEVTKADFADSSASFLNTTCSDYCIGTIVPEIAQKYPNSEVEMSLKTSSPPLTITNSSAVTVLVDFTVELKTKTGDSDVSLLTLDLDTYLSLKSTIEGNKLRAKIVDHSFNLTVIESSVGNIDTTVTVFNRLIDAVMTWCIVPKANEIAQTGMDLPVMKDIKLYNIQLFHQEGNVLIGTDVMFK